MSYAVIMHIYNEAEHLEKVIHAIQHQTIRPKIIHIVDNGSTDYTDEILHKMKISHIHYPSNMKTKPYQRRAHSFNKALETLPKKEPYILKVDGDTVIKTNYAEELLNIMRTQPYAAAASGMSANYHKTRDLNNGAVMYDRGLLPLAEPIYGWDRQLQLKLTRMGFDYYVTDKTTYTDLRPPNTLHPSLLRVARNRIDKKISHVYGRIKRRVKK